MKKRRKIQSKEIGLDVTLIFAKYFLKTEYLHLGYWKDDLKVDILNLAQAQEDYATLLISQIPDNVKTILDVGCGSGKLALKLVELGYQVDCVSPSSLLTDYARKLLGDKSHIYECYYEDLKNGKEYDLILFSESFQYIPIESALENSLRFLNDQGYILICDYFRKKSAPRFRLGGGHYIEEFNNIVPGYPLSKMKEIDITKETSRGIILLNEIVTEVGQPIWNLIFYYLDYCHPRISKFIRWKFRKKISKIERRFFDRKSTPDGFINSQSYRLMLFQKH